MESLYCCSEDDWEVESPFFPQAIAYTQTIGAFMCPLSTVEKCMDVQSVMAGQCTMYVAFTNQDEEGESSGSSSGGFNGSGEQGGPPTCLTECLTAEQVIELDAISDGVPPCVLAQAAVLAYDCCDGTEFELPDYQRADIDMQVEMICEFEEGCPTLCVDALKAAVDTCAAGDEMGFGMIYPGVAKFYSDGTDQGFGDCLTSAVSQPEYTMVKVKAVAGIPEDAVRPVVDPAVNTQDFGETVQEVTRYITDLMREDVGEDFCE
jgi:hypothetical protein